MNQNIRTVVIKIGGSVVTQKHREGVFIRRKTLSSIASQIRRAMDKDPDLRLILIHGAGAGAHQLAKKYNLSKGSIDSEIKRRGAILIRLVNQKLNQQVAEILFENNLMVTPVHTASMTVQYGAGYPDMYFDVIDSAIKGRYIPLMYGEIVFNSKTGMSICSGDTIAIKLAKKYQAQSIIFTSDIDGVFDKDPHINRDAKLIDEIILSDLLQNKDIHLSGSHHVDVTGGLANKVAVMTREVLNPELEKVIVCNGLKHGTIYEALNGRKVGTIIKPNE